MPPPGPQTGDLGISLSSLPTPPPQPLANHKTLLIISRKILRIFPLGEVMGEQGQEVLGTLCTFLSNA